MSNVTSIAKSRDTEADPLRAALSAAIEAEAEAKRVLDRAEQALQSGRGVLTALDNKLQGEKHHVEKAKESDSRRTAAAVRNRSSASPDASATRAARLRVQACEDEIEVAQGAIERLEQDLAQAEVAVQWAVVDTMAARSGVLAPICRTLIERARDARRSLAVSRALLVDLLNDPGRAAPEFRDDVVGGIKARERITAPLVGLRADAERATMMANGTVEEDSAVVASAVAAMRQAISSLTTDAAAEIPPLA